VPGNRLASSSVVALQPGQTVQLDSYNRTLTDIHDETGSNYTARVADLLVEKDGRLVVTVR
jgi:cytochrome c biogenesis factor